MSPPIRGRGLKYCILVVPADANVVAPYTGAWIEIGYARVFRCWYGGRPLYGGVD